MDTWMVAVAAGAGYIAQHFKKFKQPESLITSDSSSFNNSHNNKPNSPKHPPDKKWPFRKSTKNDNKKQDDSNSKVKIEVPKVVFGTESTSTSEPNDVNSVSYEGSSVFSPRSRMLLKNRRPIKPLTSLESCVMAQLHTKHIDMKEYIASPSSKTTRPFLVTDGSKVINRSSGGSFTSEIKQNDAMLHVCLGMSFGILYSFMENRREVEKLNRLLKQTESLVQDLEEELEMKDSLVMQEITIDDQKSQRTDGGFLDDGNNLEQLTVSRNKESVIEKVKDESFSEIEAELEAELQMLELNMSSSTLERRISDLFEVDPDFEPGVAHGELRADIIKDESGTTTTTPHSTNYSVSPRELSLRLHELLQSQLEQRIKELEAEIEFKNSPQFHKSWKDQSSSDAGDENPNNNHMNDEPPVVLNLSGEALDAYNEACNEFAKFDDDSDEETPVNGSSQNGDEKDLFDEDEMEKLLIKHIVEKARQGSPMVLNAQRALFE